MEGCLKRGAVKVYCGSTLWRDGAGLGSEGYVAKPYAESPKYAAVAQYLVEHMVEAHGVGSSSLPGGTNYLKWGRSSVGRAPALQAGGREFDSLRLHQ